MYGLNLAISTSVFDIVHTINDLEEKKMIEHFKTDIFISISTIHEN